MLRTVKGIEVEGRLQGVPSVFVHDVLNTEMPHVYFNPDYLQKYGYDDAINVLPCKLVSICVTPDMLPGVPDILVKSAHIVIVLRLDVDLRKWLKPGDELRLDYEMFENSILGWNTALHIGKECYVNDEEV